MVAVRLSMSMAPRPHTSPSISSAAERVVAPVVAVGRHDVGVAEQGERGGRGVGTVDLGHQRPPARRRLVDLHVDAGTLEIAPKQVGTAKLLSGGLGAVVHAPVPDQLAEEVRRLLGPLGLAAHQVILRRQPAGGRWRPGGAAREHGRRRPSQMVDCGSSW